MGYGPDVPKVCLKACQLAAWPGQGTPCPDGDPAGTEGVVSPWATESKAKGTFSKPRQ